MMEELHARFLPQFVTLARSRIAAGIDAATRRDPEVIATTMRELHSLAGEAGLLGLEAIIPVARDCEQKARQLHLHKADAEVAALIAALRQLESVIDGIELPESDDASAELRGGAVEDLANPRD
jgi:HPt (histidine-containing phosphotransfer) domain-containing protein